ncbi:MAG: thioredoxin family protein [Acidobacteria bacterium]|nr:thioredoxin family protein [Acidobacteriota bacterium]
MKLRFLLVLLAGSLLGAERPYDPKANPAADLTRAVEQARKEKKNILLDVGGEWCSWCHRLDQFFAANAGLLETREKNFVFLKVNFSPENENKEFLGQFPKIEGYPHLIVLDSNGKLLKSQETDVLEEGKGYNLQRFSAFLAQWAPKR